jgi:hypothetical protein
MTGRFTKLSRWSTAFTFGSLMFISEAIRDCANSPFCIEAKDCDSGTPPEVFV